MQLLVIKSRNFESDLNVMEDSERGLCRNKVLAPHLVKS